MPAVNEDQLVRTVKLEDPVKLESEENVVLTVMMVTTVFQVNVVNAVSAVFLVKMVEKERPVSTVFPARTAPQVKMEHVVLLALKAHKEHAV